MRIIPIECIRDGSFLGKTIYDNNGRVLLKPGAELTNTILNKEGCLTYDEYELMKDHPKREYDYLSQHYELNSACKIITNAGSMFDYEIVIIFTKRCMFVCQHILLVFSNLKLKI